jgi:hypothetical protein
MDIQQIVTGVLALVGIITFPIFLIQARKRANQSEAQLRTFKNQIWDDFWKMLMEVVPEISSHLRTARHINGSIRVYCDDAVYAQYDLLTSESGAQIQWVVWPTAPDNGIESTGHFPLTGMATRRSAIKTVLSQNLQQNLIKTGDASTGQVTVTELVFWQMFHHMVAGIAARVSQRQNVQLRTSPTVSSVENQVVVYGAGLEARFIYNPDGITFADQVNEENRNTVLLSEADQMWYKIEDFLRALVEDAQQRETTRA